MRLKHGTNKKKGVESFPFKLNQTKIVHKMKEKLTENKER